MQATSCEKKLTLSSSAAQYLVISGKRVSEIERERRKRNLFVLFGARAVLPPITDLSPGGASLYVKSLNNPFSGFWLIEAHYTGNRRRDYTQLSTDPERYRKRSWNTVTAPRFLVALPQCQSPLTFLHSIHCRKLEEKGMIKAVQGIVGTPYALFYLILVPRRLLMSTIDLSILTWNSNVQCCAVIFAPCMFMLSSPLLRCQSTLSYWHSICEPEDKQSYGFCPNRG